MLKIQNNIISPYAAGVKAKPAGTGENLFRVVLKIFPADADQPWNITDLVYGFVFMTA